MDLQQAKLIMNKINRLYESMELDSRNIDVFEQDLMLSYIKQLYDAFDDEAIATPTKIKRTVSRRVRPVIKETPVEVVKEAAPPVKEKVAPPPPPPVFVPEVPKVEVPEPMVETPAPPPPPIIAAKPKSKPEHDVLFEQQEAKELSEKLSSQPIRDLKKAMGINEKILTINELFKQDNRAYDAAIDRLNGLHSFEAAKEVLSELAENFEWTKRNKKKKAQIFIKLVRRRYL